MSTKLLVTFDDRAHEQLLHVQREGCFPSQAATIRKALELLGALQSQAKDGYRTIQVRRGSRVRTIEVGRLH